MRRAIISVGILAALLFAGKAQATIVIKIAEVQNGLAVVQGSKAVPNANILWEGTIVTQANKAGNFSFSGVVPADCIGTLSDGTPIEVTVLNCTPGTGPGVGRLSIVDAGEKTVGDVIAFMPVDQPAQTAFNINSHSFFLYVFPTRFAGTTPLVYFTELNCSGTPILPASATLGEQVPTLLPRVAVAKPGSTVYLAETTGPAQNFSYNSTLTASFDYGEPGGLVQQSRGEPSRVWLASKVTN
jgi:hypothetical protein